MDGRGAAHGRDLGLNGLQFFDLAPDRSHLVSDALDKINDRYGEFVITPALMMGMNGLVVDRIAFGNVRGIEDLYE